MMIKGTIKKNEVNMSLKERLEEYKRVEVFDHQLNFLINKREKERLDKIAKENKITTSLLLRCLIHEFLNQQTKKETGE